MNPKAKIIIHKKTVIKFVDNGSYLIVDGEGNVTLYQDNSAEYGVEPEEEKRLVRKGQAYYTKCYG